MPQSLSKILLHLVFSTKYRAKIISPDISSELHSYIAGICRKNGSQAFRVGGVEDHIHIACSLPRTLTVSKLLEEIKKSSSKWIKIKDPSQPNFKWQVGYGVFSLSPAHLKTLIPYIDRQKEHHQKQTYKKEFLASLHKYEVEYDEEYLWD